ncbi:aminodeoxychorismate synthase component I [Aquamicrobium segne]|uniref:Aminodeoxychorismate synthase component I n=1 Tax=Aquamicrobium segne TaxID=469547 RepID=A0ABW0GYH4_9HYPH
MLFAQPEDIVMPFEADGFEDAWQRLQAAHENGKWLAGYVSYEAGYLLEPKLTPMLAHNRRAPLLCIGIFDAPQDRDVFASPQAASHEPIHEAQASWSFADYEKRFLRLHRHLREGDCYQGNLTFPIHAQWSIDKLGSGNKQATFDALTARQPVRYGALAALGPDPVVLSRSPELFFEVDDEGWIETHPMKGTTPRGKTPEQDAQLKEFLRNDAKNQAENRMIVDLLRNDISLISEVGSLNVPELFRIESYPTVHQMVSRVRAKLLPDLSLRRIFAALFPCGSITGAPKIRAMEILHDLEDGHPRDVYCGAIGWVAPSGKMRFSVAIRTLSLFASGEAIYNVGGGVVFDSTAEEEYRECLLKARFATGTLPASS